MMYTRKDRNRDGDVARKRGMSPFIFASQRLLTKFAHRHPPSNLNSVGASFLVTSAPP